MGKMTKEERAAERELAELRAMPNVTVYDTPEEARLAWLPYLVVKCPTAETLATWPAWPPKRKRK